MVPAARRQHHWIARRVGAQPVEVIRRAPQARIVKRSSRGVQMKQATLARMLPILILSVFVAGCELVGDIFQAGMWVGILAVVILAVLVFYIVGRLRA